MTPLRVVLLLVGALVITALIIWEKRKQRSPNTFRSATIIGDDPDIIDPPHAERIEPHLSSSVFTAPDPVVEPPPVEPPAAATVSAEEPLTQTRTQTWEQLDLEEEAMRLAEEQENSADSADADLAAKAEPVIESASVAEPENTSPAKASPVPEELVILYIIAPKDRDIQGAEIQQAMKEAGLQLGDMNLFHYPVLSDDGQTSKLFSVADIREPGYFDTDRIGSMSTSGLAVFMQLPGPLSGLDAFDKMLNVARQLSDTLYCTLKDERKHDLGRTEIENIKEQILKFNLKLHS